MPRYTLRNRFRPTESFSFLKLPAEIRNSIYLFTVVSSEPIAPLKNAQTRKLGLPVHDNTLQVQPGVTRVPRQLRQEALPLDYSRNTFDFEFHIRFGIHWSRNGWSYRLLDDFQKIGWYRLVWIRSIVVDALLFH